MNQAQITALLRQVLMFASAYAIGAGYVTQEQAGLLAEIVLGAVPLAVAGWALFASRKAGLVQAAARLPNVTAIDVTTESFADKVPSEKVQSTG